MNGRTTALLPETENEAQINGKWTNHKNLSLFAPIVMEGQKLGYYSTTPFKPDECQKVCESILILSPGVFRPCTKGWPLPPAPLPPCSPPSLQALPATGVMPYKRAAAADKSGLPVYQPLQQQQQQQQQVQQQQQQQQHQHQQQQQALQASYHQLLQLQQQPNIVPVTCKLLKLLLKH